MNLRGSILLFILLLSSLSFAFTNINSCQTLGTANTVYNLTANITTSGACLTISANNITVLGNGFTVRGGAGGDAIFLNSGTSNCNITNLTAIGGDGSRAGHGIGLQTTSTSNNVFSYITAMGGVSTGNKKAGGVGVYDQGSSNNYSYLTAKGGTSSNGGDGGNGFILNSAGDVITNINVSGGDGGSNGNGGYGIFLNSAGDIITNINASGGNGGSNGNGGNALYLAYLNAVITASSLTGGGGTGTGTNGSSMEFFFSTITNMTLLEHNVNTTVLFDTASHDFTMNVNIPTGIPADPSGASNVSSYMNYSSLTAPADFNNVYMYYTPLNGYNQNKINLWNYTGGAWIKLSGVGTLDTTNHRFDVNMSSLASGATIGLFDDIDTTAPSVTLNSPANNTFLNVTSLTFNFTATDPDDASFSCSLILDGATNQTNSSVLNSTLTNFQVSGLTQASHTWQVNCTDGASNHGSSTTRNFTINTVPPVISIISPQNSTYGITSIPLNFTVSGNVPISSCWYYLDGSGPTALPTCSNTTLPVLSQGHHNLTVFANDSAGNLASASANFTYGCLLITAPGSYSMTTSFSGSPNSASPLPGYACVEIAASNVVFNCNGYNITGNNNTNTTYGVLLTSSQNNVTVINCRGVSNYTDGLYIDSGSNDNLTNDAAFNDSNAGFYLDPNSYTDSLSNDNAFNNSQIGFQLNGTSNDSLFNDSAFSNAQYGIYLQTSNVTLSNNAIYGNSNIGLILINDPSVSEQNDHLYGNTADILVSTVGASSPSSINLSNDLFDNPSDGLVDYTNTSIYDSVPAGAGFTVRWSALPAALPSGYASFASKYLNISNTTSATGLNMLQISWQPSELAGYYQSDFELWEHNSSGWYQINNTPDLTADALSGTNGQDSGVYALLQSASDYRSFGAIAAYRSSTSQGYCNSSTALNCPKIRFWNATANGGTGKWGSEIELPSTGSPVEYALAKWSTIANKLVVVTQSDDGNLTGYVCASNCTNSSSWTISSNIGNVWSSTPAVLSRRFDFGFEQTTGNGVLVYGVNDPNPLHTLGYIQLPANGSTFGSTQYIHDQNHNTTLQYSWIRLDSRPTSGQEMIFDGFDSTDNQIDAWVWNGSVWNNQTEVSNTATSTSGFQAFDVKYASDGSYALILGGNDSIGDTAYQIWNGSSWSQIKTFRLPTSPANVRIMDMKADPASDAIMATIIDSNDNLTMAYWNTTSWTIDTIAGGLDTASKEDADFEWESAGSKGRVIWERDGGGSTLRQMACTPLCNNTFSDISSYAGAGSWLSLYRNPNSTQSESIVGLRLNSGSQIGSFYFNGSSYTNYGDNTLSSNAASSASKEYSMAFKFTDVTPPKVSFVAPTPANGTGTNVNQVFINVTASDDVAVSSVQLEWNGTNQSMTQGTSSSWYLNETGLADGTYYYKAFAIDSSNNTNVTETRTVRIDTSVPNITFVAPTPPNGTVSGSSWAYINIASQENLSTALLEWNGTNQSMTALNGTNWFLNETGLASGAYQYKVYGNNTVGTFGMSETRTLIVNSLPPAWSGPQKNDTPVYWNDTVLFNASWTDGVNLNGYIFSTNQSGSWANSSLITFSGLSNISQNTSTIIAPSGSVVGWYFWANNSVGKSNQTDIQAFTVQSRPTMLTLSVNQTTYPQGRSPGNGFDIYIPFTANYSDLLSGVPVGGATCYVTNNETADNVTLSFNSTTGLYYGNVTDYLMFGVAGFNATCTEQNYAPSSNSTTANVWLLNYLWGWENLSYSSYNYYTSIWLRKEPPLGPLANLSVLIDTTNSSEVSGPEFYSYGSGVNGSFLKDYTMLGNETLRLNVSINDTSCQPYLCLHVEDFSLDTLYETCGIPQSIPVDTPTILEQNISANFTVSQNEYLAMHLHLNCSSSIAENVTVFYNNSGEPAGIEIQNAEPSQLIAYIIAAFQLDPGYIVGPNQTANSTAEAIVSLNNPSASPIYTAFFLSPPIPANYPNSIAPNTTYIYNSTVGFWASDNSSAGAPNVATVSSNNQIEWLTETVPPATAVNESGHTLVVDAIRDGESLYYDTPMVKAWNVTVFSIFVPQISTYNVTAFTNYSEYGVPDDYAFNVTLTNTSGTYDITGLVTLNSSAKTLTFPPINLMGNVPVNYTVTSRDITPPNITFAPPTPDNATTLLVNWAFINISSDKGLSAAELEWNGTNQSMSSLNSTSWYLNETGLVSGNYTYKVYGNDSIGNLGVSEVRTITIDLNPPAINFTSPTPADNSLLSFPWAYINITSDKPLSNVLLEWNGTNQSMSSLNSTSWFLNETGLAFGSYSYKVYGNDTGGVVGISETRILYNSNPPSVVILSPLGESHYQGAAVSYSINATDPFGIDTAIAEVTYPNGSVQNVTLGPNQPSDDFSNGANWFRENISVGPSQTCIADINTSYPGKAFTSLSGSGSPESDTLCSLIARRPIDGDFDMNISFNITGESGADNALNFEALEGNSSADATEYVFMALSNFTGEGKKYEIFVAGENFSGYIYQEPTDDTYGKMRIVRSGDLFSFYIWNNTADSWYLANSSSVLIDRPLYPAFEAESSLPAWGSMNVTWGDFGVSDDNATFASAPYTGSIGLYNITFFVNNTFGAVNGTQSTNFTVYFKNQPPSTPFELTPSAGSVISGTQNVTWSEVFDAENDSLQFNITLLNPDGSDNATLVSDYGDSTSTSFPWDTTAYPDGEYSIRVTVFENETPEHLSNSNILVGTFFIDNHAPAVVINSPHGEDYDQSRPVDLSINVSSIFTINTSIATVTLPNGSYENLTLGSGLSSDDFSSNTMGNPWFVENVSIGPLQTCTANIDTTIPGKAYTSLSGNGAPQTDTLCSIISNKSIDGDFDIQVSFNMTNESGSDHALNFQITRRAASANEIQAIFMDLSNWTGQGQSYEIFADAGNFSGYILQRPTNDTYGKFRMVRAGDNFAFYTWDNVANDWHLENVSKNVFNFARGTYVTMESETAADGWGPLSVAWSNFTVQSANTTFGMFQDTGQLGDYNVTFTVTDNNGLVNDSEKTNFTILPYNNPPSPPYVLAPSIGSLVNGTVNITWSNVYDTENDSVRFNITLLNPDFTANTSIVTDYGDINSTTYTWDTTTVPDGSYSLYIVVYENETPEHLSNHDTLHGTFNVINHPPSVVINTPLGETYPNTEPVDISTNITSVAPIDTALAYVTLPNGTVVTQPLGLGLLSDNFTADDMDINWFKESYAIGPGQTCTIDINGTVPGSAYSSLSGLGDPMTDTLCSMISTKAIDGDFDISVSYDILNQTANDSALNFQVTPTATSANAQELIYISRSDFTGEGPSYEAFGNDGNFSDFILRRSTYDTTGKLRIKRVGDNFTFYTWNNTAENWDEENVSNNYFNFSRAVYVTMETESALPAWGSIAVAWNNFTINDSDYYFGLFGQDSDLGLYNVSIFANNTLGAVNDTEKTNFTIIPGAIPPSTPFIILPTINSFVSSPVYNITWEQVTDALNNSVRFNITLLNPDLTPNATLVSDYGDINSVTYPWNTSGFPDGYYSMRIDVYENETVDHLSNHNTLFGTFILDTSTPSIDLVPPSETSGSLLLRNYILVNATSSDPLFNLMETRLYNSSGDLLNTSFSDNNVTLTNFTGLPAGLYYFNATALDLSGKSNSSETRNVSIVLNCPVITQSGSYTQTGNYAGAPNPVNLGTACVVISASDVVFDCGGFGIANNGTLGTTYGVLLDGPLSNVTVQNCPAVSDYTYDVYSNQSADSMFANLSATSASYGLFIANSTGSLLSNVTSDSNSQYGLYVSDSDGTNTTGTLLYNNGVDFYTEEGATPGSLSVSNMTLASTADDRPTALDISDTVEANTAYLVKWSSNTTALPAGLSSFAQKFVNISTLSGPVSIDQIVWTWQNGELAGHDPSLFELWGYNGTWQALNTTPAAGSISLAGLQPNGIYGIVQLNYTTPPQITLNSPPASYDTNSSTIVFNATASDTYSPTLNCSLFIDGQLNQTNASVLNNQSAAFTVSGLPEGTHNWTVQCTDLPGNTNVSESRAFTNDYTPPTVTLNSPPEGLNTTDTSMPFNFTSIDELSATTNCSLILDGSINQTNASTFNNTPTIFEVNGLELGTHSWNISCVDNADNAGTSPSRDFLVYYSNLSAIKLDQTALQPSAGGVVEFNITVNNTGNTSLDVSLTDTLPAGITYLSSSPSNVSSGPFWNATIPQGSYAVYYLNATVDPGVVNSTMPFKTLTNCITAIGASPYESDVSAGSCANVTVYYANASVVKLNLTAQVASQGGMVQYGINVTNTGDVNLSIAVNDALDSMLTYNSTDTTPVTVIGNNVNWTIILAPGESQTILLNASGTATPVGCQDTINNVDILGTPPNGDNVTASSSVTVPVCLANESVVKLNLTAQVASQGGIVQYGINVTNTGNVSLTIAVNDTLDSMLTYNSTDTMPVTVSGNNINWTIGLAPGASQLILLNASVTATPVGCQNTIDNVNVIGTPPNGDNVTASSSVTVPVCLANVSVIKLDQTSLQPSPGGIVQFNMTVTNTGNVTLDPVNLSDTLPTGLTFLSASPANSSSGPGWNASLSPGSSRTYFLNATVNPGVVSQAVPELNLTNCINALGVPLDGSDVSASSCANVTVYYANVSVIKVDITPLPPSPGGLVQWLINVSNPGQVTLNPVTVIDTLPTGFQFLDAAPSPSSISPDNKTINWTQGPIAPGGSLLLYLNSTVNSGVANGTYSNIVTVVGTPPNGAAVSDNDTASVGVFAPAINLVKTVNQSTNVNVNANVTYTLNISNSGSINISVNVIDILPSNVAFQGSDIPPTSVLGQTVSWQNVTVLPPGGSFVINYNVSANESGVYTNHATATGSPPNGNNVSSSDSATFIINGLSPPPSGGGNGPQRMGLTYSFQCPSDLVIFNSTSGGALSGVSINVISNQPYVHTVSSLTSDNLGQSQAALDQNGSYTAYASASGYLPVTLNFDFSTCPVTVQCRSDNDCPADAQCASGACLPVNCPGGQIIAHQCQALPQNQTTNQTTQINQTKCTPPSCCTSDSQCGDNQQCATPDGARGTAANPGSCANITGGCGFITNHAFVQYPCGSEAGCPSCPDGYTCSDHSCSIFTLTGPQNGTVGAEITIHATMNSDSCRYCGLLITLPNGTTMSVTTDGSGNYLLHLSLLGTYQVKLVPGNQLVPLLIQSNPAGQPPSGNAPSPVANYLLPLALILLLAILLLWMRRKRYTVLVTSGATSLGQPVELSVFSRGSKKAMPNIPVSIYLNGNLISSGKTNRFGKFSFTPVARGSYAIHLVNRGRLDLTIQV